MWSETSLHAVNLVWPKAPKVGSCWEGAASTTGATATPRPTQQGLGARRNWRLKSLTVWPQGNKKKNIHKALRKCLYSSNLQHLIPHHKHSFKWQFAPATIPKLELKRNKFYSHCITQRECPQKGKHYVFVQCRAKTPSTQPWQIINLQHRYELHKNKHTKIFTLSSLSYTRNMKVMPFVGIWNQINVRNRI